MKRRKNLSHAIFAFAVVTFVTMWILVILLLGFCATGVSLFSPNGTFQRRCKIMSREAIAEDDDIDLDITAYNARRAKVEHKQEFDGYA